MRCPFAIAVVLAAGAVIGGGCSSQQRQNDGPSASSSTLAGTDHVCTDDCKKCHKPVPPPAPATQIVEKPVYVAPVSTCEPKLPPSALVPIRIAKITQVGLREKVVVCDTGQVLQSPGDTWGEECKVVIDVVPGVTTVTSSSSLTAKEGNKDCGSTSTSTSTQQSSPPPPAPAPAPK